MSDNVLAENKVKQSEKTAKTTEERLGLIDKRFEKLIDLINENLNAIELELEKCSTSTDGLVSRNMKLRRNIEELESSVEKKIQAFEEKIYSDKDFLNHKQSKLEFKVFANSKDIDELQQKNAELESSLERILSIVEKLMDERDERKAAENKPKEKAPSNKVK